MIKLPIHLYSPTELSEKISQVDYFSRRDAVRIIHAYTLGNSRQVLALYGLRRTGKTIAMLHAIKAIGLSKCIYIECIGECKFDDLLEVMNEHRDKVIFVDEITNCDSFSDEASWLSSLFTECGKKVIISGTDSLRINLASHRELFDRVGIINMTYCSFYEYKKLHPDATVDSYLRTGTIQTPEAFLSLESCNTYIQDAIIANIWNTMRNTLSDRFRFLLQNTNLDILSQAVCKRIDKPSADNADKVLRRMFKEAGISTVAKDKKIHINHSYGEAVGFTHNFNDDKSATGIARDVDNILNELHILGKVDEYNAVLGEMQYRGILLVPGMQYRLVTECLKHVHMDGTEDTLLGVILEDMLVYHTPNALKVKFADGEFDMLVYDKHTHTCSIYEIKHSDKVVEDQYQYLIRDDLVRIIEPVYGKVVNRTVLYMGESLTLHNGIYYKNIEEYLLGR